MNSFTEKMLNSPYVVAKPQEDHNLISLNFSRKAFQKNIWNAATIHARGLFVDATTGDVKMRSYNKFFYIDTDPTGQHLQFPAIAYKKYNGFLGIMSVVDGDIVLASKSTTQGPFKELFQEIWNTLDDDDVNTLKDLSEQNNFSFVFEVCHVDDKHIINFNENHLYLLDAIPNTYNTAGITVDTQFSQAILQQVKPVSEALSLKEELCTFNNRAELDAYVDAHRNDHTLEGMVLVDDRGYMCKEKFLYYMKVKQLRGYLGSYMKAHLAHNPLPNPKQAWMKDIADKVLRSGYFTDEKLENLNIIDAVKFYESYYKILSSKNNS